MYGQPTDTTLKEAYVIEGCPLSGGVVTEKTEKVAKLLSPLVLTLLVI
jgi:hypothetical protein